MNRSFLIVLVLFTSGAFARESNSCLTTMNMREVPRALGEGVMLQPVYGAKTFRGWRLWGIRKSPQLAAEGLPEGALVSQVCGIAADEIFAEDGHICCGTDAAAEFSLSFQLDDQVKTVLFRRKAESDTLAEAAPPPQAEACPSGLSYQDMLTAMAGDIRVQPLFSPEGLKGWRLYGAETSEQLEAQEIASGSTITHVCGVAVGDIGEGKMCCNSNASREFELTLQTGGRKKAVLIRR